MILVMGNDRQVIYTIPYSIETTESEISPTEPSGDHPDNDPDRPNDGHPNDEDLDDGVCVDVRNVKKCKLVKNQRIISKTIFYIFHFFQFRMRFK